VDGPWRVVCRRLGAQERAREPPGLIRDRQLQQVLAEDDNEVVVGITSNAGPIDACQRAAQGLEQAELIEPPEAVDGQPPELGQSPLLRRSGDEPGVAPNQLFRLRNDPEVERKLILEARTPQQPERVVAEDGLLDSPEAPRRKIVVAAERIHALTGARTFRDRIDAEVAGRQVVLDRPGKGREVNRAPVGERDPPGAVTLGEGERRAPGCSGVASSSLLRVGNCNVDVDDWPLERLVANRAADDPRLLAGEELFDELTNRRPPAWSGRDCC